MDKDSIKLRKRLLKGQLAEYKKKYASPKTNLEKLYVLYANFEETKHSIDELPGRYDAFYEEEQKYSNSALSGLRDEISDIIFQLEDNPKKNKEINMDRYSFVEKLKKFVDIGNAYIEKTKEHYQLGTEWAMLYFSPILKTGLGKASIGVSVLKIRLSGACELDKRDSDLEPIETEYDGSYERLTELDDDCILSFNLSANDNRFINIIVAFRTAWDRQKFGMGTYNQYDGKKIHSGRLLLVESNKGFNEVQNVYENFIENKFADHCYPLSELMLKSENYICAINKYADGHLVFDGGGSYVVGSQKYSDINSKFIDPPQPHVFLGSNLPFLHLIGVKSPPKKNPNHFNLNLEQSASYFADIYKRVEKESRHNIKPFGLVNSPSKFIALNYTTFFIYLHDSSERSLLTMTFLGAAIQACKYVLIIYEENSLDDDFLNFFNESNTEELLGCIYKLRTYNNLKNDRSLIENHILSFIEYNIT